MRRPFRSVRARTSLAATAVVAVALVAAGLAVLLSLRADLTDQADRQADSTARDVALRIIAGVPAPTPYGSLRPGDEDHPVQVVTRDGQLLAASRGLRKVTGDGMAPVRTPAPAAPSASAGRPRTTGAPASPTGAGSPSPSGADASAAFGRGPVPAARAVPAAVEDGDDGGGRGRGRGSDGSGGTHGDDGAAAGGGRGGAGSDDRARTAAPDDHGGHGADDASPAPPALGNVGDVLSHTTARADVGGRDGAYRFVTIEVTDQADRKVLVRAGASLAARQSAVATATAAMLAGLPLLLLVVGGVTWLVTRRALTPVEGIRREMAAITASADLSRRVPQPATHDEVARLARTTNETLTALEAAVDRQRRFVADASHELRSPIASLRTQLEVGSAHPHLLDVPGAVEDAVRLQRLAADLLLLARLDAGEQPGGTVFDLTALVREEVSRRTGDRLPVAVDLPRDGRTQVAGSRAQLARVLGNLLDNAQRHASGRVAVTVHARDGGPVLEVADDGAGVPEAERERVFERFVRLDDARGRDDGGAGLGLAIARDVAVRHGGTLGLGAGPGGGARFVLRLPAADRVPGARQDGA